MKRKTIKDIAKESGFSLSTVSLVLNNHPRISQATRDRVLAVVKKYNFYPNSAARGLASKSSKTLSVVVPNLTRGCRPYGLIENVVTHGAHRGAGHGKAVLEAALQHAWRQGCYKVMLMTGRKDPAIQQFYCNAGFDPQAKQAFYTQAPD